MSKVNLSPRLAEIARLIGSCDTLADVGTDHAYLPAALIESGSCRRAFACDIGKGPLQRAAQTVRKTGCENVVSLILSDGLRQVPELYDVLVIAGMGGELIASILQEHPPLPGARLFFQPMTHPEALRTYLYGNGYTVREETAVCEKKRAYIVLSVQRIPDPCAEDLDPNLPRRLQYSPSAVAYLKALIFSHQKRLDGLLAAQKTFAAEISKEQKILYQLEHYYDSKETEE